MKNDTFLALQGPDGGPDELANIAETAKALGGRLNVMHIGPVPILAGGFPVVPYTAPTIPEGWIGKRNEMAEHLAAKQADTRQFLQDQGLTGEVSTLCIEPAALHDLVAMRAIFADVSVVMDSLRAEQVAFQNVVYGLLFEAPGPVVLNAAADTKALTPDNVLVGWDNSLPATRAIRAALPLLKAAKDVTIACIDADASRYADGDAPGADLGMWLSHHGCHLTVQEYASGHDTVAQTLLARARERGADLIVMGAYGRNRWNERFFGGTTESMIRQTDLPVLIAH